MSSAGQIIGGIAGATIGLFVGNPILGAQLGMMAGGLIDPPKGPKIEGPRLSDLSVQLTGYGNPIPRVYGTTALMGTIFWVENNALKETATTQESGGKGGGGGQETTTYSYSATFALGLCQGPIDGIKRIWISGKLVYDAGAPDANTALASAEFSGGGFLSGSRVWNEVANWWLNALIGGIRFTVYQGTNDQLPDPRMQASLGVDNTPAYRGLSYIVFEDLQLADYGNSLMGAQIKVEVVASGQVSGLSEFIADSLTPPGDIIYTRTFRMDADGVIETSLARLNSNSNLYLIRQKKYIFGSNATTFISNTLIDPMPDGFMHSKNVLYVDQTDTDCCVVFFYKISVVRIVLLGSFGTIISDSGQGSPFQISLADLPFDSYRAVIDRGQIFLGNKASKIYKLSFNSHIVQASADTYDAEHFGVSENYIFAIDNSLSTVSSTTVYKISRDTLATVATYVQPVYGDRPLICVIDDDEFYTQTLNSPGTIYRWVNGVATDTGIRYVSGRDVDARLFMRSPTVACMIKDVPSWKIYLSWAKTSSNTVPLAQIISDECQMSKIISPDDIETGSIVETVRGYKISATAAIRSSIEPLQAAWPFDVIQSGYQIKFIPRGQSAGVSVDIGELGAVAGNEKAVRITHSREMDLQLPRRVEVNYIDVAREYDPGAGPGAERLNSDAVNILKLELPIVLNASEAAQVEERLLYMYWLERSDISFTLPPTYANLEAADVLTINSNAASYEVRLTSINLLPDGRLECSGKFNNAAVYTSVAVGADSAVTGQVMAISGPSKTSLLDLPCIDSSAMNRPALLAGMSGYTAGWRGGILFRSSDNGQTWDSIQGFTTPQTVSGVATSVLGSGVTHIIDTANTLTLTVDYGSLSSVTDLAMFNGANHFAVGAHGRWEIIAAKTATLNGDGTYTLSNLMRGRFGSEWAMSLHSENDAVVLLDRAALRLIDMNTADINMERVWRGVTSGKDIGSASDIRLNYAGENLECWSPVYLNGHRSYPDGAWTITCTFRSRLAVEAFSGIATPSGESVESWVIEIWDSSFATLKRTIADLAAPSASYSAADQVTDWGFIQETLYVRWYRLSAIVGRGHPLQGSITRLFRSSGANYSPSVLALSPLVYYKLDDATSSIIDSSASANTATASASGVSYQQPSLLSGATPGYSLYMASSGYVTIPRLAAMDGAYTAVALIKPAALQTLYLWHKGDYSAGNQGHTVQLTAAGKLTVEHFNTAFYSVTTANPIIAPNEKAWIACVYDGATTFTIYKNGAAIQTLTLTNAFVSNTQPLTLNGVRQSGVTNYGMTGWWDEFAWFNYQLSAGQISALYEES